MTIRTEMTTRRGLAGKIERWLILRMLQPMYAEELRLLESVASQAVP